MVLFLAELHTSRLPAGVPSSLFLSFLSRNGPDPATTPGRACFLVEATPPAQWAGPDSNRGPIDYESTALTG